MIYMNQSSFDKKRSVNYLVSKNIYQNNLLYYFVNKIIISVILLTIFAIIHLIFINQKNIEIQYLFLGLIVLYILLFENVGLILGTIVLLFFSLNLFLIDKEKKDLSNEEQKNIWSILYNYFKLDKINNFIQLSFKKVLFDIKDIKNISNFIIEIKKQFNNKESILKIENDINDLSKTNTVDTLNVLSYKENIMSIFVLIGQLFLLLIVFDIVNIVSILMKYIIIIAIILVVLFFVYDFIKKKNINNNLLNKGLFDKLTSFLNKLFL